MCAFNSSQKQDRLPQEIIIYITSNPFNIWFKMSCLTSSIFFLLSTSMMTTNGATLPTDGKQRNTEDLVSIGDRKYVKEEIPQLYYMRESRCMSENSHGDIYTWDGFAPKVLKVGWDSPQSVEGAKHKVIKGLVVDSKDNLFYVRTFEGLFVVQPGREEIDLAIHIQSISIHIDNMDNIYIGNYDGLYKIHLFYDREGLIDYGVYEKIDEMEGVIIPAGVMPNGDIYYQKKFFYFFYRNLFNGRTSEKKVKEIGSEDTFGAAVDLDGNSYVATIHGLLYLPKDHEGQVVEHVQALGEKQVNGVWVNWRTGHILVAMADEGFYRLTPTTAL